jgi:carbon-monoxide dehydrogenase small subunit
MTAGAEQSVEPLVERSIRTVVNGEPVEATVPVRLSLADWLREGLGLTGTHLGCEQGVCGACTVMVDGEPTRSCLMFAVQAEGCSLLTIEGLSGDTLHHLQQAFAELHGLQCGFCTPGMILASLGYLSSPGPHGRSGLRRYLSGNICRCTGYVKILDAVEAAAEQMGLPWSG